MIRNWSNVSDVYQIFPVMHICPGLFPLSQEFKTFCFLPFVDDLQCWCYFWCRRNTTLSILQKSGHFIDLAAVCSANQPAMHSYSVAKRSWKQNWRKILVISAEIQYQEKFEAINLHHIIICVWEILFLFLLHPLVPRGTPRNMPSRWCLSILAPLPALPGACRA